MREYMKAFVLVGGRGLLVAWEENTVILIL
jgi:hypothetical protein